MHGLLDVVVDSHFEAVQALDDGIEAIETICSKTTVRGADCSARLFGCARS